MPHPRSTQGNPVPTRKVPALTTDLGGMGSWDTGETLGSALTHAAGSQIVVLRAKGGGSRELGTTLPRGLYFYDPGAMVDPQRGF